MSWPYLSLSIPPSPSQAFLQHPDAQSAEENHDYIIIRMLEALKTIALLADGEDPDEAEYGVGSPPLGSSSWQETYLNLRFGYTNSARVTRYF